MPGSPRPHCETSDSAGHEPVQIGGQDVPRDLGGRRLGTDDNVHPGRNSAQESGSARAHTTFDPVSRDRATDGLGHNKTDPRRSNLPRIGLVGMHDDQT